MEPEPPAGGGGGGGSRRVSHLDRPAGRGGPKQRLGSIMFDEATASKRSSQGDNSGQTPPAHLTPNQPLSGRSSRRSTAASSSELRAHHTSGGAPDPDEYHFGFFADERRRREEQLRQHHEREEELRSARRKHTLSMFATTVTTTANANEEAVVLARLEQKRREERLEQVLECHSVALGELLQRSKRFAELKRSGLGLGQSTGSQGKKRKSVFAAEAIDTGQPQRKKKPSASQLASPEAVQQLLETNEHLIDAIDNCAALCSSVLSRTLAPAVYCGSTEDREEVEARRQSTALARSMSKDDAGLAADGCSADDLFSLTQTLGASVNEKGTGSAEALVARKQLKAAIDQRKRDALLPVNHPTQAAADIHRKWVSMSQRSLVKPPLHCEVQENTHSHNTTAFDAPNTNMFLPLGKGGSPDATDRERHAKLRLAEQYAQFMLDIEEHPERDFLAGIAQRLLVDTTLRIVDDMKTNKNAPSSGDAKDVDEVDVTEFVVTNKDDAARVAQQQEQRNQHTLFRAVSQVHSELSYFFTGMDFRPATNFADFLGDDDDIGPTKPKAQFKWQDAAEQHRPRLPDGLRDAKPSDDGGHSLLHHTSSLRQPASMRGLAALRLTNQKFRAAADLVAKKEKRANHLQMSTVSSRMKRAADDARKPAVAPAASSAPTGDEQKDPASPAKDAKSPADPMQPQSPPTGSVEELESGGGGDGRKPHEDLSLVGLREGLNAIKRAKSRVEQAPAEATAGNAFKRRAHQLRSTFAVKARGGETVDVVNRQTLTVTESVVGKKQAATVEKFRRVMGNTMNAPAKPWHEEGRMSKATPRAQGVQQGRFDLFQRSPAVEMLLGGSTPRVQSARSSKYSSWTF